LKCFSIGLQEGVSEVEDGKAVKHKRKDSARKESSRKKAKMDEERREAEAMDEAESVEGEDDEDNANQVPLLDRPTEVSGTRVRKQVQRLNINTGAGLESPDRRRVESLPGRGVKLSVSPRILAQMQNVKHTEMTLLHRLLFKRPGTAHEIKRNIREFSGFLFTKEDKEFESRKHLLEKNTLSDLKFICQILCLEKSGTKEVVTDRILEFLLCPNPVTLPPTKSPKRTKKPKKDAGQSKTKASSAKKSSKLETSQSSDGDQIAASTNNNSEGDGYDSADSDAESKDAAKSSPARKEAPAKKETSPVKKVKEKAAGAAKKAAATTAAAAKKSAKPEPRSPIKVKLPPLKHKKNDPPTSEPSEPAPEPSEPAPEPSEPALEASEPAPEPSEPAPEASEPAPEPSKTTPEPSEPAPEPSKQTPESPASPTDQDLVDTIKKILEDANLEDLTMKNLCRKVYDTYPQFDLEKTKKDFIRASARQILGST